MEHFAWLGCECEMVYVHMYVCTPYVCTVHPSIHPSIQLRTPQKDLVERDRNKCGGFWCLSWREMHPRQPSCWKIRLMVECKGPGHPIPHRAVEAVRMLQVKRTHLLRTTTQKIRGLVAKKNEISTYRACCGNCVYPTGVSLSPHSQRPALGGGPSFGRCLPLT